MTIRLKPAGRGNFKASSVLVTRFFDGKSGNKIAINGKVYIVVSVQHP